MRTYETLTRPPLLYHYTDFNGLQGIVESHSLRATLTTALNDGSELQYGREVVAKTLKQLLNSDFHRIVDEAMAMDLGPQDRLFAACFCARPDLLGMWRGYAGNGGGFSLGFNLPDERTFCGTVLVTKVSYGDQHPRHLMDCFRSFCGGIEDTPGDGLQYCLAARALASKIKHIAFKDEEEWRIIRTDARLSEISFRPGYANIRPYVNVEFRANNGNRIPLPLEEVIVGPTLRSEDKPEDMIRWMLDKNGLGRVRVQQSTIPYRL
jgi:hypothetical protein